MRTLETVKRHLKGGGLYRRQDLLVWSKSVDRHLQELVKDGTLKKLRGGLYYKPKKSVFGEVPADTDSLVRSFLKDNHFLVTSFNTFNSLGLGTTQLYNHEIVYNHKRHGFFKLGGRQLEFRMRHRFPRKPTPEFYLVDMLNNLEQLAEDRDVVLAALAKKLFNFNPARLNRTLSEFGTVRARKIIEDLRHGQKVSA